MGSGNLPAGRLITSHRPKGVDTGVTRQHNGAYNFPLWIMSHINNRTPCQHRQRNTPVTRNIENIFFCPSGPVFFHRLVQGTAVTLPEMSSVGAGIFLNCPLSIPSTLNVQPCVVIIDSIHLGICRILHFTVLPSTWHL